MHRFLLLMVVVLATQAEDSALRSGSAEASAETTAGDVIAAPEVSFRDLEWWGPDCKCAYGWHPGRDLTPMPLVMGRIEALRLTGIQEMVWEHTYYRVQNVLRESERRWVLGFELGTLKLTHLQHQRWQVEFTPAGGEHPTRIFRTRRPQFGSDDQP